MEKKELKKFVDVVTAVRAAENEDSYGSKHATLRSIADVMSAIESSASVTALAKNLEKINTEFYILSEFGMRPDQREALFMAVCQALLKLEEEVGSCDSAPDTKEERC